MAKINPADGVYEWDAFDALLAGIKGGENKRLEVTLGHPPDWMVFRPAVGGATAYGGKSNMCPDDLDAFCDLVRVISLRAQAAGFVHGLVWDAWNEINGTGFYNDDINLLGPYVRRVSQTVRQYDPLGSVLAPNTNTSGAYLATVLAVPDGAGGTVADWCDGGSIHTYHPSYTLLNAVRILGNAVGVFKGALSESGIANPQLHVNEAGIAASMLYASTIHGARMKIMAALGCSSYSGYQLGHATYGLEVAVDDWNATYELLAGKYIEYAAVENGVRLVIVVAGASHVVTLF
jgi:hypothetical protein